MGASSSQKNLAEERKGRDSSPTGKPPKEKLNRNPSQK